MKVILNKEGEFLMFRVSTTLVRRRASECTSYVFAQTLDVSFSACFPSQGFECNEQEGPILRISIIDSKKFPRRRKAGNYHSYFSSIMMSFPLLKEYSIEYFFIQKIFEYLFKEERKEGKKERRKEGRQR